MKVKEMQMNGEKNRLDEMLKVEAEKAEVVEEPKVTKRKATRWHRGRPNTGDFIQVSIYIEKDMWRDMKGLAKRVNVVGRSALIRMLISRLRTRVQQADYARETADKAMAAAKEQETP